MEMAMDKSVSGEEVLSLLRRFESLHLPLAPLRRSMCVFRAVVQIPTLSMFNLGKQLAVCHAVASQLVGHDHARHILKALQQPSKKASGGVGIPPWLNEDVEHDPVLIHGTPCWQPRLHEKGGKEHAMPCNHALAEALRAYIDAAGVAEDRKGWLFRTSPRHNATVLTKQPMMQADAWRMVRRRAAAAGLLAPIGNHTFRATGITAYLANGGAPEHAQSMAAHESPRTTKLYDRTQERLTQDKMERIRL
jgi:hypothetical protein